MFECECDVRTQRAHDVDTIAQRSLKQRGGIDSKLKCSTQGSNKEYALIESFYILSTKIVIKTIYWLHCIPSSTIYLLYRSKQGKARTNNKKIRKVFNCNYKAIVKIKKKCVIGEV